VSYRSLFICIYEFLESQLAAQFTVANNNYAGILRILTEFGCEGTRQRGSGDFVKILRRQLYLILHIAMQLHYVAYGVATISELLQNIGLFCRIQSRL